MRFHLLKEGSHTAKVICDNTYVDNVCVGALRKLCIFMKRLRIYLVVPQ